MIIDHRLNIAKKIPSENYNQRPDNTDITLVVIHNISLPPGEFGNTHIEDFFTNKLKINKHAYFKILKDVKVSAHLLIKRDGSIVQFVDFNQRAWHAGQSSFNEVGNCNNYSIGIELEGTDNSAYETSQYTSLNQVLSTLRSHYPITDIKGHNEISPGRKTDPGPAFEWSKLT